MLNLYLAHPINGRSYDEVHAYYLGMEKKLMYDFEILNPMTGKEFLRTELSFRAHGYDNPVSTNHAIFGRDIWMVRKSDIVFVDLTQCGDRVSIGCCMELAVAKELGKHTIVAMETDNIHRHAFVLEAADIVFPTSEEALDYLQLLGGS